MKETIVDTIDNACFIIAPLIKRRPLLLLLLARSCRETTERAVVDCLIIENSPLSKALPLPPRLDAADSSECRQMALLS